MSTLYSIIKRKVPLRIKKSFHKLRKLVPSKLDLNWALKSGLTIKVASNSDWVIYNDIFVDGEYDSTIQATLQSTPTDRRLNILDIGANVGFFTLRFVDLLRQSARSDQPLQITLVEGSPKVFAELSRRLLSDNNLAQEVRIVNGLVGERNGCAKISEGDFHAMNSMFFDQTADTVNVDFVNLDTLFDADEVIDLLKCDIEGAELLFIENYRDLLRRSKKAVFELHHDRCDTERCRKILADIGFPNQQLLRATPTFSVYYFAK